ncbi:antitoxin [Streptomyces prunicolor]|uniref:antitoxin n=1 Tax=Streptomyces prunicolor TaxID=67348 RepID=UPI003720429E
MFDNLRDLDKLKDKAEEIAEDHGDKITDGLEKAGDLIDEKTDGKHSEQIDTGVDKAQRLVERLAENANAHANEGGDDKS